MDITIFAWIFIIVFFLVYTGVQTQRCCKTFKKTMAQRRNRNTATTSTNVTQIYTVEGNSRQQEASNSSIDFSVPNTDRSFAFSRSSNMFYLGRTLSVHSDDSKKDDELPSYEEAIAIIKNNQTNNVLPSTTVSSVQLSSHPIGAGASSSVVINIQTQVTPT